MHTHKKHPTILYIGGDGRSGSTLLDMILSNHPDMFGAGELEMFFADLENGGACSCGKRYEECPFWKEVLRILFAELPDINPSTVTNDRILVESPLGRFRVRPHRFAQIQHRYGEVWSALYQAIAEVSGKPILIDSSKSAYGNARRIHALHNFAGSSLNVLHLIRDPRAVVYSEWGRGNNQRLEDGKRSSFADGLFVKPLVGWMIANLAVSITSSQNPSIPVHQIHYERLATDPIKTLEELDRFLEIDLDSVIEIIRDNRSMNGGHGVRGNRMRRQGPIKIRVDTEWVESMPTVARRLMWTVWPVARRYGYDVMNWPTVQSYLST